MRSIFRSSPQFEMATLSAKFMLGCWLGAFSAGAALSSNLNSSSKHHAGGESDVPFKGDFVRNDYAAYLHGYPGHQSRLAILGPPTEEQKRGYELTLDVHRKTIDRCRAGVTAGEIYSFVVSRFKKSSIDYTASLVGHGIGPWFHQQEPVLRKQRDSSGKRNDSRR